MEILQFIVPEFLFCEIPIKNNSFNDNRIWVYHIKSLSLIEFIKVDDFKDFSFLGVKERFEYENSNGELENWFGVYVQNNCEATGNNQVYILENSWRFLKEYLIWEDKNIDKLK
jgi:hypothetical protein